MAPISTEDVIFLDWLLNIMIIQSIVYGLYSACVIMSSYILIRNGIRKSKARAALLLVTLIMFMISTAHIVVHTLSFKIQFPTLGTVSIGHDSSDVNHLFPRFYIAEELLERASYFLSDVIVVWRTWCIWNNNFWVKLYLAICLLATFATSTILAVFNWLTQFKGSSYTTLEQNMLGTFCLLVTNFSTTVLCAYKVWDYLHFIGGTRGMTRTAIANILLILVESGAIYCIFWIVMLLGDFGYYTAFELEWLQPHFSGIYVAIIVVLVALQKSPADTVLTQISHPINFAMPEPETKHSDQI